jgi:thymidylate kinase
MSVILIEGIDYSGKTEASKIIAKNLNARCYVLLTEQKELIHNLQPIYRFSRSLDLNYEIFKQVKENDNKSAQTTSIIENSWVGTIAYHNTLNGCKYEEDTQVQAQVANILPDKIVFVKTDIDSLTRRMLKNHPKHVYEENPQFLMKVQEEYMSVLNYFAFDKLNVPFVIIRNNTNKISDLEKEILSFKSLGKDQRSIYLFDFF